MSSALLILVALIVATPAILLVDGPIIHGIVGGTVAAAVAVVASAIRPGEAGYLAGIVRPIALLAGIPAIWMLVQILPLGMLGLAHPIWDSAASALGRPIAGTISIDLGATLLSLSQYLASLGIALLATAVAVDRNRAEWLLFALVAASTAISAVVIAHDLGGFSFLGEPGRAPARSQALDIAAIGTVLSAAATIRTYERHETRRANAQHSGAAFVATFITCIAAFAACLFAALFGAGPPALFAVGFGLTIVFAVVLVRRLAIGPWGLAAIATAVLIVAIGIIVSRPTGGPRHPAIAFASETTGVSMTQRMLADAPWVGTGAGTFSAVLPIYRDIDDAGSRRSSAPTAAAKISVELGPPALWAIVVAAIGLIVFFLRGALRRGRDSFYPTAGAACASLLLLFAFTNMGIFGTAPTILAASALGLALAQNQSRSI